MHGYRAVLFVLCCYVFCFLLANNIARYVHFGLLLNAMLSCWYDISYIYRGGESMVKPLS